MSKALRRCLAPVLFTTTLLLAACGSGGSSGGATASSGSGSGGASTAASSAAGGSASGGAAASGDPIVIGHAAGTTGFMSVFDIPVQNGMKLAIDDINAAGGVLGRPLKLVTSDNASDVGKIQSGAEQVLGEGAQMVFTSCDYDMGAPAARAAADKNVIAFSCAGSPNFGLTGVGPLAYNISPGSVSEGVTLAEYAKEKGYTKPYLLTDTSLEYSQSIGDYVNRRWADLGGQLAGQDTFANSDASVEAQVGAIRDSGADVIVVSSYPPGGAKVLAEIRTQGIDLPILGAQAFDGTYWLDAVPDLSNFTIPAAGSISGDDPVATRNEFFTRYQSTVGEPAASSNYPLSGYSAVQAYQRAVQAAGSTDTAKVQAALNTFDNEPLLVGPTTYTADCHIPSGREFLMVTYTDGKPAVVGTHTVQDIPGGAPC